MTYAHSGFWTAPYSVLYEEPYLLVFANFQNVNIFVWTGSATEATTDHIASIIERQLSGTTRWLSTVHVMTNAASPPTHEARRGFAEIAKRWEHTIGAVALVFEREGFWGSAMRSAITSVMMLLPKGSYPIKVHRNVAETAAWLPAHHQARCGVRLNSPALLSALEQARTSALDAIEPRPATSHG